LIFFGHFFHVKKNKKEMKRAEIINQRMTSVASPSFNATCRGFRRRYYRHARTQHQRPQAPKPKEHQGNQQNARKKRSKRSKKHLFS